MSDDEKDSAKPAEGEPKKSLFQRILRKSNAQKPPSSDDTSSSEDEGLAIPPILLKEDVYDEYLKIQEDRAKRKAEVAAKRAERASRRERAASKQKMDVPEASSEAAETMKEIQEGEEEETAEVEEPKRKESGFFSRLRGRSASAADKKKENDEVSIAKATSVASSELLNPDGDSEINEADLEAIAEEAVAAEYGSPPQDGEEGKTFDTAGVDSEDDTIFGDSEDEEQNIDFGKTDEEVLEGVEEDAAVPLEEVDLSDEDLIDDETEEVQKLVSRSAALERARWMKPLKVKKKKLSKKEKKERRKKLEALEKEMKDLEKGKKKKKKKKKKGEDEESDDESEISDADDDLERLKREGKPYPLCCPKPTGFKDLAQIGVGVAMYFRFEYMFCWFFGICTVFQAYAVVAHYLLANNLTDSTFITDGSLGSWGDDTSDSSLLILGEGALYFVQFVFFACFLVVMQIDIVRQAERFDKKLVTAADYTAHFRRLKKGEEDKKKLKGYFKKWGQVHRVVVALKISKAALTLEKSDMLKMKLQHLENRIRKRKRALRVFKEDSKNELLELKAKDATHAEQLSFKQKYEKKKKNLDGQVKTLMKPREKLIKQVEKLDKVLGRLQKTPPRTSGDVFVTFKYEADAQNFIRDMSKVTPCWTFCRCFLCWCCCGIRRCCCKEYFKYPQMWRKAKCGGLISPGISVRKADEPDDIFWLNLELSDFDRFKRSVKSWSIVFILVILNMAGVIALELYKDQIRKGVQDAGTFMVEVVTRTQAVVVVFTNYIIKKLLIVLAGMERKRTKTEFETSLVWSLTFAQVTNSVLVPFIASALSIIIENLGDPFLDIITKWADGWYISGGLAEQVFIIVLINAFLPDLVHILQPGHNLKKHCCSRMKCCRKNQAFMDKLVEPPDFILAERYAAVMKTILMSLVYGPMIPLAYPITFLGLILTIVVDYMLLLRVYKKPPSTTHQVAVVTKKIMSLGLIIHIVCAGFFYVVQAWEAPTWQDRDIDLTIMTLPIKEPTNEGLIFYRSMGTAVLFGVSLVIGLVYLFVPITYCCQVNTTAKTMQKKKADDLMYDEVPGIQKYKPPVTQDVLRNWEPGSRNVANVGRGAGMSMSTKPEGNNPQMLDLGGLNLI